ncbi:aminopeptidase [Microbacterium sp. zg.Y625]|uniref:aminopeptidase n=1 Tax=Microbacterium jiangjiandongii TaxID=3049071 RepID=UPI00214BA650|nr:MULTISPECIES: aminopeptidase [unclassified Microbacterium]MCR2793520.1 aminopeptidase [Microbacterium sp. zg.Y625]WIM25874.1 aminopeptidase [Microbacterium sp. zg-Y625]
MSQGIDWRRITALVADGVRVASGDKVSVFFTDASALAAVAAFVDECWRRGAVPQVVATDERFDESALRWADATVLEQAPPLEAAAMRWCDVHVSFRAMTSPVVDAEPTRIAALRHGRGIVSTLRWQETRWALVRTPTPEWAQATGQDADRLLAEWAASFDADWPEAEARMSALCAQLDQARTVVIEDSWGRLELPVAGRRWVAFSGSANWPDGEIATAPLERSVSGVIHFPGRFWFAGVEVCDLELEFEAGLVVRERATEGLEFVRNLLDTDAGARRVGELGIGTNAALTTMTGDLLIDEKVLGTVHIALGRAYPQCGGVNKSALHWDIVKDLRAAPGGSLSADGTWLIRDGAVQPPLVDAAVARRQN